MSTSHATPEAQYYAENLEVAFDVAVAMDGIMSLAEAAREANDPEKAARLKLLADTAGKLAAGDYLRGQGQVASDTLGLELSEIDPETLNEFAGARVYHQDMAEFVAARLSTYRSSRAFTEKDRLAVAKRYVTRIFRDIGQQRYDVFETARATGKNYAPARQAQRTGAVMVYDGLELRTLVLRAQVAEYWSSVNPADVDTLDLITLDYTRFALQRHLSAVGQAKNTTSD